MMMSQGTQQAFLPPVGSDYFRDYLMIPGNVKLNFFQKLRAKLDSNYAQYKCMQMCGPVIEGWVHGYNSLYWTSQDAAKQGTSQQVSQSNTQQTEQTQSGQAQHAKSDDPYKPLISSIDRIMEASVKQSENLAKAMQYMAQKFQHSETQGNKDIIENLTKALYQTQQEYSKSVQSMVHELSALRRDYTESQVQYQHLVKEMGDQVRQIIDSYEKRHAQELSEFKALQTRSNELYQGMLERATASSTEVLKAYMEQQRLRDEKILNVLAEEGRMYRDLLARIIEKTGYQKKPVQKSKSASGKATTSGKPGTTLANLGQKLDKTNELLSQIAHSSYEQEETAKQILDQEKRQTELDERFMYF